MDEQSKTWDGMISNLMDQMTRFSRMVMDSGAFAHLKDRLRTLLDTINDMAESGRLQEIADLVGKKLVAAFEWTEQKITRLCGRGS